MNVEIGTEAAQFPEKEYTNGIFLAVWIEYLLLFVTTMSRREMMNALPTGLILRVWTSGYWHIDISNSASTYAHTDCDKIWIRCQANSFVLWDMAYIMDFI